ncbi:stage II sporulation protein M [Gottfriedia solisilvae]|nr:stage II sporulation protein M [Gottfriedia solisilvae]
MNRDYDAGVDGMTRSSVQLTMKNHVKDYMPLYIFVSVILLFGVVFGAVIVNSMNVSQKQDILSFITQFFGQVNNDGYINGNEVFLSSYSTHLKFLALIWILGISIIGLPIILILLFMKGLVVGFTVGFLVNQLGWHGILLAFSSVFPQNVIVLPLYILLTVLAVQLSIRMIRKQFMKNDNEAIMKQLVSYSIVFCLVAICLSIASVIEAYGSSYFLKAISEIIVSKN